MVLTTVGYGERAPGTMVGQVRRVNLPAMLEEQEDYNAQYEWRVGFHILHHIINTIKGLEILHLINAPLLLPFATGHFFKFCTLSL